MRIGTMKLVRVCPCDSVMSPFVTARLDRAIQYRFGKQWRLATSRVTVTHALKGYPSFTKDFWETYPRGKPLPRNANAAQLGNMGGAARFKSRITQHSHHTRLRPL